MVLNPSFLFDDESGGKFVKSIPIKKVYTGYLERFGWKMCPLI